MLAKRAGGPTSTFINDLNALHFWGIQPVCKTKILKNASSEQRGLWTVYAWSQHKDKPGGGIVGISRSTTFSATGWDGVASV